MAKWKKHGKTCAKRVLGGTIAALLTVSGVNLPNTAVVHASSTQPEQDPMKIRFDEPLSKGRLTGGAGSFTSAGSDTDWWQQLSLPIGNSYMGANVYGEVEKEHLTFNQKTLWNGGPSETQPHTGGNIDTVDGQPMSEYLKSVENAFLTGDSKASDMCGKLVGSSSREYGAYQGWGDIYLDFDRVEPQEEDSVIIGDNSDKIKYGEGWDAYPQADWEGGSEHFNNNPGTLTVTFTGTGIQMIGVKGPDMGNFEAIVDNDEKTKVTGSMNQGTRQVGQVLFEISGLEYGDHTLTFTSSAKGNAKKTSFDCFKVSEGETIDWNPEATSSKVTFKGEWGRWDRTSESDANSWFGKDEVFIDPAKAEGAEITCKFRGAGFELFGAKSDQVGKFQYKVDDGEWKEVDTNDATFARQSLLKVNGLDKTQEHTLTIKGVKDNKVSFDGIVTTMKEVAPEDPETQHTETTNYERALDIDTALATVSYDRDYTHYEREYFASYPDNVIAMKLTAEEIAGSEGEMRPLEFEVSFPVEQPGNAALGKEVTYTIEDDSIVVAGKMKDNGLKMNGRLKVVTKDGTIAPVEEKEGTLLVSDATEVYIYVTADTDYEMTYPKYRTGETDEQLAADVKTVMDKAVQKGYDGVKADAQADYKKIYDRVKIDLGQQVSDKTVDELIQAYKDGTAGAEEKAYLETLIFQYGRYLQISSTREGDRLPANLQGVWLDSAGAANSPVAWGSDYHMNVNLQMNYWPTYVTNMAECAEPLIDYVEGLREPGRVTASTYFGIDNSDGKQNGFTAHTQNTPFGWTCPGWAFSWGWSPAAVPWILQNVYEAYEFSGDVQKLESEIFPMLVEEAKFYMSILKEVTDADGTKRYVTVPAYSPEHGPYTAGNVYENVLVWQLFNDCIEGAQALNANKAGTVSEAQIAEWTKFRDGLKPIEIGDSGQIKEWYDETAFGQTAKGAISGYDSKHRHLSHLLGVYPGDLVTVENKEYMDAAKVSLTERGDNATGWGIAQRLNTWARTGDGNHSYQIIDRFIKNGIYSNLWDSHPPYQIDGNFGFTSGVAEMLLQSNAGYINLLPAMPENTWTTGSVSGLIARGNFEVSESWADGALTGATILSKNGGTCTVQAGDWTGVEVKDSKGNQVAVSDVEGKDGRVTFETTKGESYVLTKADAPSVEKVTVTFKDGDNTLDTRQVNKGAAIGTLPKDPVKEGYTFKEWNTEADGKGTTVTASTKVDNNMTVYAVFDKNGEPEPPKEKVTVTFKDGDKTLDTRQVDKGAAIGTLPEDPVKEGYTFKEWNTQEDGKGTTVTETTKVDNNMTVYAVFDKNGEPEPPKEKVTVTFKDGDKTLDTRQVDKGAAIGALPEDPVKKGYTFKEWNTEADGTGTTVTASTKADGDMTVYAVFEQDSKPEPVEKVTVTFKDGDNTLDTKQVEKGTAIGTLPNAPVKEGYTFKEWNTEADGTGNAVTAATKVDKDMTVYAIFAAEDPGNPEGPEDPGNPEEPSKPDKQEAKKYYDACLSYYVEGDYTAESWKGYVSAMNALKAAIDDDTTSKEELQAAIDAVAKATKELKKSDSATPGEDKNPDKPNESDAVKTGDNVSAAAAVSGLAAAAVVIAVALSERRKRRS